MNLAIEILIVAMLAIGAFFSLVGSIGLLRLGDFLRRLHGPTKATTLGVGGVLVASILYQLHATSTLSLRELLITLFLFLTAPVSAHLLAKAAMALHPDLRPGKPGEPGEPGTGNRPPEQQDPAL